jgi:hypothetical protein
MTIYIDDSGTSPENAVAVAAGWIAHTDSWVAVSTEPVCPRTSDLDCVEDCLSRRTYQLPNSRLLCRRKDIWSWRKHICTKRCIW